ncbi:MAG: FAD-binding protein [Bacteroidales bacterium]|jgi:uncharacterized FAD-dependent dehydrogenase|nr:FAD-binding protein [Bacteroidales bacterium]MDY0196400.1 FAD-binding protein [Tenuifilaceae bacterium]
MPTDVTLVLSPRQASNESFVKDQAIRKLGIKVSDVGVIHITRKSIDARKGKIQINVGLRVFGKDEKIDSYFPKFTYNNVTSKPEVIIVGSGPAGLFAALRLLELGYKPIILERGKDVSSRKRDVAMLNRNKSFEPNSNYAFGEGGAGTFSDGKLYTRSRKRGDINRIISTLHLHGAQDEILYEAHPHIGTNILPRVITNIHNTIELHGGVFLINSKVDDLIVENAVVKGVVLHDGTSLRAKGVILATGHSARDIYQMLWRKSLLLEAKPFAIGVRVEHPQELIDSIQYHGVSRGDYLPAASYSLVDQVDGRGVYSFCMCPGGFIVPAVSGENQIVVNGMSPSARSSKWANSGIVVEVRLEDIAHLSNHGPLAGLEFQMQMEQLAYRHKSGDGFIAPAQRLDEFVASQVSNALPECSYQPGVSSSPIHEWLPNGITKRLQEGFKLFDRRLKGFITNEALVVALESRTSSPIRIPRDSETLQHLQAKGLFPCGEGAGYAGGIVSSAVDGERCAEACANWYASI